MNKVQVKQGQSLFDIALIYTGSIDRVFDIAEINNISITEKLISGKELLIPDPKNKYVSDMLKQEGAILACEVLS